jgi:hypothetical protein
VPQPGRFVLDKVKNVVALDGIIGFSFPEVVEFEKTWGTLALSFDQFLC